jgi:hypothetical protein
MMQSIKLPETSMSGNAPTELYKYSLPNIIKRFFDMETASVHCVELLRFILEVDICDWPYA